MCTWGFAENPPDRWKTHDWFCSLLDPPAFPLLLCIRVPLFIPFCSFFTFLSLSCLFYLATPHPPLPPALTHLLASLLSARYGAVRGGGVPVNSAGQVMNLQRPPPPNHPNPSTPLELFHHPIQRWRDRARWRSGRCRSRLAPRDHRTATSSAGNVGWHTADC